MSWQKIKQVTRETFAKQDQKTDIPGDVTSLLAKSENLGKTLEHTVNCTIACFPEQKIKTKNADDPVRSEPFYALGEAMKQLSMEYQADPECKRYLGHVGETLISIARQKAELDERVSAAFVEPKRELTIDRIKKANDFHEKLKERRVDLDAKKYKLKQEKKTGDGGKLKKYEVEVESAQEKFDAEANAIRELLQPMTNEPEMGKEQSAQANQMMSQLKEFFLKGLETIEKLESNSKCPAFQVQNGRSIQSSSLQSTPSRGMIQSPPVSPSALNTRFSAMNKSHGMISMKPSAASSSAPHLPLMPPSQPKQVQETRATAPHLPLMQPPQPKQVQDRSPLMPRATAPPAVPPPIKPRALNVSKCVALYDFAQEEESDLGFVNGDLISILKDEGEWWNGKNIRTGKIGNFPANYVRKL